MNIVDIKNQVDNIRRSAERGLSHATSFDSPDDGFVDLFQHLLDEIALLELFLKNE